MLEWAQDIFSHSNLWILLFSALPGIIYSIIIYFNSPKKSIYIKTGLAYFLIGIISIQIVQYFNVVFPYWKMYSDVFIFLHAFVQVALIEEIGKYIGFIATDKIRGHVTVTDHPIATMFYSGLAALSFATIENFFYAMKYGEQVLITRSVTATILHMLCGFIIGYFIALSRMKPNKISKSIFSVFMGKFPKVRQVYYTLIGLIAAVSLHGLYDYNLFLGGPYSIGIMIFTLIVGLALTYFAGKHLIRLSVENKNKNNL